MTQPLPMTSVRSEDRDAPPSHGSLAAAFGLVPPDDPGPHPAAETGSRRRFSEETPGSADLGKPGDAETFTAAELPDAEDFASWRHEIEAFFREAHRRIDEYRRQAAGARTGTSRPDWREQMVGGSTATRPRQGLPANPATPSTDPDASARRDPSDPLMRLQEIQRRLADRLREDG